MKSLAACLKETLAGKPNAFNEVVLRFYDQAFRRAYAGLGDRYLAEDAVQDAFLTAYVELGSLRRLESFPGWFRSILRSCTAKVRRANSRSASFLEFDDSLGLTSLAPSASADLEHNELTALVRQAIEKLTPMSKEVCKYYYVQGHSSREIAGFMDVPVGTVKRRLHDARRQLKELCFRQQITQGIRVGYMPISDHLLAMVAQQINNSRSMTIELQKFLSWTSLANAICNGLIDAAFIMAPLALSLRAEGHPIIYVLDAGHGGSALTVKGSIDNVRALRGRRLGLPLANSTHKLLLRYFLDSESVSLEHDIFATYLSPSYSIGALRKSRIDGFFCAEPWNTKAVKEGIGKILIHSNQIVPDHICCIVVAREAFAFRRGEMLQDYLKLLLSARDMVIRNPRGCSQIQARYTGISQDIAEHVLSQGIITFLDLGPNRELMEQTMAMSMNAGILTSQCDLDSFCSNQFM